MPRAQYQHPEHLRELCGHYSTRPAPQKMITVPPLSPTAAFQPPLCRQKGEVGDLCESGAPGLERLEEGDHHTNGKAKGSQGEPQSPVGWTLSLQACEPTWLSILGITMSWHPGLSLIQTLANRQRSPELSASPLQTKQCAGHPMLQSAQMTGPQKLSPGRNLCPRRNTHTSRQPQSTAAPTWHALLLPRPQFPYL